MIITSIVLLNVNKKQANKRLKHTRAAGGLLSAPGRDAPQHQFLRALVLERLRDLRGWRCSAIMNVEIIYTPDKVGLYILLDLPCSGEWHRFSMPTVMYTSFSADTIGQS